MEYLSVTQARELTGLRLVLTVGVPGPWSESAKKILEYKGLEYAPVAQHLNQENRELLAWVGVRNAPVLVCDNEAPITSWRDILLFAERRVPNPALLPHDSRDRELALHLANDICGEGGFGWSRRLMLISLARSLAPVDETSARVQQSYGFAAKAVAEAPARAAEVLRQLGAQLRRQQDRGFSFLVGEHISACDIYWACFSLMVRPPAHDLAPMPEAVRQFYGASNPQIDHALDDVLIEHRDAIFARYFKLPLDF
jgi:glutathione S-transferase